MGTSFQYTLKEGFLDEIRFGGTRVRINEKLEAIVENKKLSFKLVSGISNFKSKDKLNVRISNKVNEFINKHKTLKKPPYIGHVYKTDSNWAIIRTIHIKFLSKKEIFPYLYYNIWILDEQKKYKKINVCFELEFQRILSGNFQKNKKIVEAGIPKSFGKLVNFKDKFFRIDCLNKIKIFFEHSSTSFEEFEWSIKNNKIRLKYSKKPMKRIDILKFTKPDILLSHKKEIQDAEFNKLHFFLEKNNWLGILAILTTHFSEKEIYRPTNIRMFKEFLSFSKISFFEDKHQNDTENKSDIIVYKSDEFQLSNKTHFDKITSDSKINSEILEEYLEALTLNFSNCKNTLREVFFILPNNSPEISLLAVPFIRYSRGYPLINNKNIDSNIISTKTVLKIIYLINTDLEKEKEQILLKENYQIHKIKGNSKEEFVFNLQNTFIKTKCIDYLVSSYFLVPEKLKRLDEKTISFDDDIIHQRKEIIAALDSSERKKIKSLVQNVVSVEEFVQLSYDLSTNLNQNLISQIFDIYQFTKDFHITYKKNKFKLTNPYNYNGFHGVFIDLNSRIPNLIGPIVYASYRSLVLIPCNLKKLNEEGFTKIKYLYENNTNAFARNELVKRKNKIEKIVLSGWIDFFYSLLKNKEVASSKLDSEVGLGYITIFLPSTKVPYECLFLDKFTLGSLFSTGRIPIEDSTKCLKIVNNCFRQFIYPRPKPHTLSLIPYLNRTPEEKAHTEFITYIVKSIFSPFEKSKVSRFASIYKPTDLANTLQLLLEASSFFFWGHGGIDWIELRGQTPHLELTTDVLESCHFLRPEFVILGSCNTAASLDNNKVENLAQFFLKKGFLGICASFWKIDITTAIYGILNVLFKIGEGNSLSAIIRKCKYSNTEHFPEVFIYFGDPTYRTDFYYENERIELQESIRKTIKNSFKSTENLEFRVKEIT